jgi:ABC-2 type transport system permease protein
MSGFSLGRWLGVVEKEFLQLKRDRLTFGMIVGIPILELLLFGFAINSEPHELPTAVVIADPGPAARAYVEALGATRYFKVVGQVEEREAERLLDRGEVQFIVTIPAGFHRDLVRGHPPTVLVEADATDPMAVGGALAGLRDIVPATYLRDMPARPAPPPPPIDLRVHRRYNPETISAFNIVPGVCGVILTMTMVLMTGLAMTRERERGTFEMLLATPATPFEVMTGKIAPYILIGIVQVALILGFGRALFDVPFEGSLALLALAVLVFICANLTLGMTLSSLAKNQLQSMQMAIFFFLPSILLSGFMFPFRGMPEWAQWIGSVLPLTHFLVLVRGILLKGVGLEALAPHLWAMLAFTAGVLAIGLKTFRRTLD